MGSKYQPSITRNKTIESGASIGTAGILLAFLIQFIRAKNPDLPWTEDQDIVLLGALTGVLSGAFHGIKNWLKNRGVAK